MESTAWVISPNTNQPTAGNTPTPGKSPYYQQQEYTPTVGTTGQSSNPASGSNSMQFGPPSQQPTPQPMHHVTTPSNFTDSEQMFLHQFEQNLYEEAQHQNPHLSNGDTPSRHTPGSYPDNIQVSLSTSQQQQQQQQHHHSNSHSSHSGSVPIPPPQYEFGLEQMTFIIPDDMAFDENHNIPHQGSSSAFPPQQPQQPTPSMLPANKHEGDIFSPLLPGQNDRSYNNQHYFHRQNSSNKIFTQAQQQQQQQQQQQHVRPDAVFTPLVSPAVTPLDKPYRAPIQASFEPLTSPALNAQPSFSTTNSTTSSGATSTATTSTTSSTSSDKRKYEDSGTGSTYKRRTPHGTPILAANNKSSYSPPASKPRNGLTLPETAIKEESTMLPPAGGKPMLNTSSSSSLNGSAPLMGFTMGRLAEEQGKPPTTGQRRTSSMSRKSSTSSSDSSSSKKEKPATKKASHKLAEQGRRNRMNMAVHELGGLIPQSYHDEVTIPSKATTVELASKYITALLKEIDELKSK